MANGDAQTTKKRPRATEKKPIDMQQLRLPQANATASGSRSSSASSFSSKLASKPTKPANSKPAVIPDFQLSLGEDGAFDTLLPLTPNYDLEFQLSHTPQNKQTKERIPAKINNASDANAWLSFALARHLVGSWTSFTTTQEGRSVKLELADESGNSIRFCTIRLPTPSTAKVVTQETDTSDPFKTAESHARLVLIHELVLPTTASQTILNIPLPDVDDMCDDEQEEVSNGALTRWYFQLFRENVPLPSTVSNLASRLATCNSQQLFVETCGQLVAMITKGGDSGQEDGSLESFGSWKPFENHLKKCCDHIGNFSRRELGTLDFAVETLTQLQTLATQLDAGTEIITMIDTRLKTLLDKNDAVMKEFEDKNEPKPKFVPLAPVIQKKVLKESTPQEEARRLAERNREMFGDGDDSQEEEEGQGTEEEMMEEEEDAEAYGVEEDDEGEEVDAEESGPSAKRAVPTPARRPTKTPAIVPQFKSKRATPQGPPAVVPPQAQRAIVPRPPAVEDSSFPVPAPHPPRARAITSLIVNNTPAIVRFDQGHKNDEFGGRIAKSDQRRLGEPRKDLEYCLDVCGMGEENHEPLFFHFDTIGEVAISGDSTKYTFEINFPPERFGRFAAKTTPATDTPIDQLPIRARVVFSSEGVVLNMDDLPTLLCLDFNADQAKSAISPDALSTDITSYVVPGRNEFTLYISSLKFPSHLTPKISIELFHLASPAWICSRLASVESIAAGEEQDERAQAIADAAHESGEILPDLSLLDPLLLGGGGEEGVRIQTAVRGKDCLHLAAFDLNSYLAANRREGLWNCPVPECTFEALPHQLLPSEWVASNLAECEYDSVALGPGDDAMEEEEESAEEGGAKMANGFH